MSILELERHTFINEPECCSSFAKCERVGRNLQLSGEEVYRDLVLPIMKAMHHFQLAETPVQTALYFDCHLSFGVAVIDAPIVGVTLYKQSHKIKLIPWVRLVRHETGEVPDWTHRMNLFAIDLIHKDYFKSYLNEHLIPFAQEFSRLAIRHQKILVSGKAFVSGMGKGPWGNFEQRIKPLSTIRKSGRIITILNHLIRLLIGKGEAR